MPLGIGTNHYDGSKGLAAQATSVNNQVNRNHTPLFAGQELLTRMRWEILDGEFKPGSKLRFADLQKRYSMGVGTIREALAHLSSEGLVSLDAGRGFQVASISKEDLHDITEMRIDFEQRALSAAINHGDDSWEVRIVGSFHLLDKLESLPLTERLKSAGRWAQAHRNFHRALVFSCPSKWLLQFHGLLFDQAERYRLLSQRHRPANPSRKGEHKAIMEAVISRDTEHACRLAVQHIKRTSLEVLKYAPQLSGGAPRPD